MGERASDHETVEPIISARPIAGGALDAGDTIRAEPVEPDEDAQLVASATRSRARVRSGSPAAAPADDHRSRARVDPCLGEGHDADTSPSSAMPSSAGGELRRATRMLRPRRLRISASTAPASRKRKPAERNAGSVRTRS